MQLTRTITSRFPNKCAQCQGAIKVGEVIIHVPAIHKAYHPTCWSKDANTKAENTERASAVVASVNTIGVSTEELRRMVALMMNEARPDMARMIAEEIDKRGMRTLEIKLPERAAINVGRQHKQFPLLVQTLAARCHVWLAGPAGSGKTTAAEAAAKALGVPFSFDGAMDTEYKVVGYTDAQGRIVSTAFRRAWENGGLHLFDECDGSLPGATLAVNAALANGVASFPDGNVRMHPDFRCIAAANTWGHGGTFEYVGRNKMDAAFLDRFVSMPWDYDQELERAIAGNDDWTKYVQARRAAAFKLGLKVVISPRASILGARLLAAGIEREEVINLTMRAKMRPEDWKAIS